MTDFVPDNFNPPKKIKLFDFILTAITFRDAATDYKAVMSSVDLIRNIRGGGVANKRPNL